MCLIELSSILWVDLLYGLFRSIATGFTEDAELAAQLNVSSTILDLRGTATIAEGLVVWGIGAAVTSLTPETLLNAVSRVQWGERGIA